MHIVCTHAFFENKNMLLRFHLRSHPSILPGRFICSNCLLLFTVKDQLIFEVNRLGLISVLLQLHPRLGLIGRTSTHEKECTGGLKLSSMKAPIFFILWPIWTGELQSIYIARAVNSEISVLLWGTVVTYCNGAPLTVLHWKGYLWYSLIHIRGKHRESDSKRMVSQLSLYKLENFWNSLLSILLSSILFLSHHPGDTLRVWECRPCWTRYRHDESQKEVHGKQSRLGTHSRQNSMHNLFMRLRR